MNASVLDRLTTVPNLLSLLRLALLPVLLGRIWAGDAQGCFWTLALAFGTDLLDGYLARRLGQVTALGAFLDGVADLGAFGGALLGVARLFPDVVSPYAPLIGVCLILAALAHVISFVRYRQPAAFHTWLAKATGCVGGIAILSLFWLQHGTWMAYLACVLGVLTQMEQVAIALTLRSWQADMPSWWHVRRAPAGRASA